MAERIPSSDVPPALAALLQLLVPTASASPTPGPTVQASPFEMVIQLLQGSGVSPGMMRTGSEGKAGRRYYANTPGRYGDNVYDPSAPREQGKSKYYADSPSRYGGNEYVYDRSAKLKSKSN